MKPCSTIAEITTTANACYDVTSRLVELELGGPACDLLQAANESLATFLLMPRLPELLEAKTLLTGAYGRLREAGYEAQNSEAQIVQEALHSLKALQL